MLKRYTENLEDVNNINLVRKQIFGKYFIYFCLRTILTIA